MTEPLFSDAEREAILEGRAPAGDALTRSLGPFADGGRPLFLFGAGGVGRYMASVLLRLGGNVVGFLDNDSVLWGGVDVPNHTVRLPVHNPETFPPILADVPGALILLVASTADAHVEIHAQCEQLGIPLEAFPTPVLCDRAAVETPDSLRAYDLWEDERSREVYRILIRKRSGLDYDIPTPCEPDQYFPPFLPRVCYRSFLDVGALNGDTFRRFLKRFGGDWDNYYAIEPNPANMKAFHPGPDVWPKLRLFSQAASDSAELLQMQDCHSASVCVKNGGDIVVAADMLDHMLDGAPVTFIKMDIERWELPALRGAAKIIRKQKPAMAISVYHLFTDFWKIPLLLRKLNSGYRLRLRHHSHFITETVCYAWEDGDAPHALS